MSGHLAFAGAELVKLTASDDRQNFAIPMLAQKQGPGIRIALKIRGNGTPKFKRPPNGGVYGDRNRSLLSVSAGAPYVGFARDPVQKRTPPG